MDRATGMVSTVLRCSVFVWLTLLPAASVEAQEGRDILGAERSGLAFRLLWFEVADESKPAAVTRFVFPAGTPYPSQRIRKSVPVDPRGATVTTDEEGNRSIRYDASITVEPGHPLLLGFVADVSYFTPAYRLGICTPCRNSGTSRRFPSRRSRRI